MLVTIAHSAITFLDGLLLLLLLSLCNSSVLTSGDIVGSSFGVGGSQITSFGGSTTSFGGSTTSFWLGGGSLT